MSMDLRDGTINEFDDAELLAEHIRKMQGFSEAIDLAKATDKQQYMRKISLKDHTSELGKQLTESRSVAKDLLIGELSKGE